MEDHNLPKTFDEVKDSHMDPSGVFKYIQIDFKDGDQVKTVVRGYASCPYHADVLAKFEHEELKYYVKKDKIASCPGGGRIDFNPEEKKINIYGHSVGFGLANHQITKDILQKDYPDFEITWSNEGY